MRRATGGREVAASALAPLPFAAPLQQEREKNLNPPPSIPHRLALAREARRGGWLLAGGTRKDPQAFSGGKQMRHRRIATPAADMIPLGLSAFCTFNRESGDAISVLIDPSPESMKSIFATQLCTPHPPPYPAVSNMAISFTGQTLEPWMIFRNVVYSFFLLLAALFCAVGLSTYHWMETDAVRRLALANDRLPVLGSMAGTGTGVASL